jgi:hypothetical protein
LSGTGLAGEIRAAGAKATISSHAPQLGLHVKGRAIPLVLLWQGNVPLFYHKDLNFHGKVEAEVLFHRENRFEASTKSPKKSLWRQPLFFISATGPDPWFNRVKKVLVYLYLNFSSDLHGEVNRISQLKRNESTS